MSVDIRSSERRKYMNEIQAREKEIAAGLVKVASPESPKAQQENDKRIRREIANSNERRRMQCINAGFSSLKALIPQLEGEKLSKAAILQHTIEYINTLKNDNSHLQIQLDRASRLLSDFGQDRMVKESYVSSTPPPPKRKKRDTESSDEGVGSLSDASDEGGTELRQENEALRSQLDVERQRSSSLEERCSGLEERNRLLEAHIMPMLHMPAPPNSHREMNPVDMQTNRQEALYNREVVEVIASQENYTPPLHSGLTMPVRPLSPTPDRGMPMELSSARLPVTTNAITTRIIEPAVQASTIVKMETKDSVPSGMVVSSSSSIPCSSNVLTPSTGNSSASAPREQPAPRSTSQHLHTYSHRDHPRRRHHQAQLERQRIEEEELRQKQEQEKQLQQQQQQQLQSSARPHYGSQNLDSLVKAICHVEGSKVLCDERKFYDEDHKMYDRRQVFLNSEESERDTSSISDQEELKSENSGRESPFHTSHLHLHPQQKQQLQIVQPIALSRCLPCPTTISSSSSSYSENYPIAPNLPHCTPSSYRPGVIVQKQS